ncbi:uncharacterized protein SCODWIG_01668 [Saccharomycodes ludwigii]|uniref:Ubiquitin-protein ligase E3A N-terminal zinc-binding domain-containing protein n=1 Tax=Saccharomycodes ludwigii TaxID=36035 RepID=A0A376B5E0_9ASCO|nr:uncharacterized protein SCODWIG_01668 [Saccharomycodes ludwigii]
MYTAFTQVIVDQDETPFSDKITLPHEVLTHLLEVQKRDFDFTKPIILELISTTAEGSIYSKCVCGVKEFSLDSPDVIKLPLSVFLSLSLDKLDKNSFVLNYRVLDSVPNGSDISLEPLGEIYYSNFLSNMRGYIDTERVDLYTADIIFDEGYVKSFLEARLNNAYTVLSTNNNILLVSKAPNGQKSERFYKFKIKSLKPADTICIVNTDLNLDIIHSVRVPAKSVEGHMNDELMESIPLNQPIEDVASSKFSQKIIEIKLDEVVDDIVAENIYVLKHLENGSNYNLTILGNNLDESFQLAVGISQLTSETSFLASTITGSSLKINRNVCEDRRIRLPEPSANLIYYIKPIIRDNLKHDFSKYSFIINQADKVDIQDVPPPMNSKLCANCNTFIPITSFQMHEIRCLRNSHKCAECGKLYFNVLNYGKLKNTHWHCNICGCNGETKECYENHSYWMHEKVECSQCETNMVFNNRIELSQHRHTDCPSSLHFCKFCHLLVPREEPTVESRYLGISYHEFKCGSKTVECYKCGKIVKMFDLDSHLSYHDYERKENALRCQLKKCANINCCNVITNNTPQWNNMYGLCNTCYGPFYTTEIDRDGKKFINKLERKYMIQLTRGCGFGFCKNPECKSSGLFASNIPTKDIFNHVQKDLLSDLTNFSLCVDESRTKRKMLAAFIEEGGNGEYSTEWVYKAVNDSKSKDVNVIEKWLNDNAITNKELVKPVC